MIVTIDAGNSRIKWGLHDGEKWRGRGALPTSGAADLAAVAAVWPAEARIVACGVAGAAVEKAIVRALGKRAERLLWLRSGPEACGVRNAYERPEQLGADRWAALIGARRLTPSACLVVCAGTATTIDRLDADGAFSGGVILPGFDLMRAALAGNTAQLPPEPGDFRAAPRNTRDAITSGCLHAQLGAIERLFSALASDPSAVCLLTGGAAGMLAPHLSIPLRVEENLIFEGLRAFAALHGPWTP